MAKSLKDQNNWKIWLIIAANALFFYGVLISNEISIGGLKSVLSRAGSLVPIGFAGIIATVLNSLPSSTTKARIVYLRWHNPLPGHRAFSYYARRDPRVEMERLKKLFKGKLPSTENEQNSEWYKLFRSVENHEKVYSCHRDSLLLRDYTTLSALFFVLFGSLSFELFTSEKIAAFYVAILLVQFLVVRQAAANCGVRLVTNVLALKATMPSKSPRD